MTFLVAHVITVSRDFTLYFLPVVLLQKLSPSTMCLHVLHLVLPHLLTIVSWVSSITSLPTGVGFKEVTWLSQDGEVLVGLPFFKGPGQESITLVCRASDRPLLLVAIFKEKGRKGVLVSKRKLSLKYPARLCYGYNPITVKTLVCTSHQIRCATNVSIRTPFVVCITHQHKSVLCTLEQQCVKHTLAVCCVH